MPRRGFRRSQLPPNNYPRTVQVGDMHLGHCTVDVTPARTAKFGGTMSFRQANVISVGPSSADPVSEVVRIRRWSGVVAQ
jgi:hypothetical protein